MEKDLAYSQSYFITICFNEDRVYTDYFFNGFKKEVNPYLKQARRVSILVNKDNQKILAQGDEADKRKSEGTIYKNIVYVEDMFLELYKIYQKAYSGGSYDPYILSVADHPKCDKYDTIILNAVKSFFKDALYKFPSELGTKFPLLPEEITNQIGLFHRFAFFLPPHWNQEVKKFIRFLFVEAELIEKEDYREQLVFFNQLETIFRYLQSPSLMEHEKMNLRIEYGRQYTIAGLKVINDTLHVSFNLFSAQYPPLNQPDVDTYVARLLNSVDFTIPLRSHLETGLVNCLKEKGLKSSILRKLLEQYEQQEFFPTDGENLSPEKWTKTLCNTPFEEQHVIDDLKFNEIKSLKSITMTEIHKYLFDRIDETFKGSMYNFDQNSQRRNIAPVMIVIHGIQTASDKERDIRFNRNIAWMVFNYFKNFINYHQKYDFETVSFGHEGLLAIEMSWRNILVGNSIQVKNEIKVTMANRLKLTEVKKEDESVLTVPNLRNPNPRYFINIAILSEEVSFVCSLVGKNTLIEKTTDYVKCELQPLSCFFDQLVTYQNPVLRVTKRIKELMENFFDEISALYNDTDHKQSWENEDEKEALEMEIKVCFSKENFEPEIPQKCLVFIHETEYVELFVVMYLGYLNGLIKTQLNEQFGTGWKDEKTAYVISPEKKLLDNSIISEENSLKLLERSGILKRNDNHRMARIVALEEEIVSAVKDQQVGFKAREYFITVQLHERILHITLHKAIKSHEDVITAIVVQDEIIPIENSSNELCENIWNYVNSNGRLCDCSSKTTLQEEDLIMLLFNNYNTFMDNLKTEIFKIFTSTNTDLDMDKGISIRISKACECVVNLSLRDIIDIGLKPVIQDITTVIAAAIANTDLLGNYEISHVFILGSTFIPSIKSPLQIVHTQIFQDELSSSIELNGKDTPGYVIKETLRELLQPVEKNKPFMYDSFCFGNINQTSSETYAVYIDDFYENPSSGKVSRPFLSCMKYNTDGASIVRDADAAMIVLQKGQPIPSGGLIIQFKMGLSSMEKNLDSSYVLKIALVRLIDSGNTAQGKIVSLDRNRYDNLCIFSIVRDKKAFGYPIHFETKYRSHNSTLQFSLRMTGDGNDYESNTKCTSVAQQSRVAYT